MQREFKNYELQPTTTRKRREHANTRRHIHADDPNLLFTYFLYFAYDTRTYEDRKRREKKALKKYAFIKVYYQVEVQS